MHSASDFVPVNSHLFLLNLTPICPHESYFNTIIKHHCILFVKTFFINSKAFEESII